MAKIVAAQVYLDEDVPDYMEGILRIGSVEFLDADGSTIDNSTLNNQLVDNTEFQSYSSLIDWVAEKLELDTSDIEIIE